MNFNKKYMLLLAAALIIISSLLAGASHAACELPPPKNAIHCMHMEKSGMTCCVTHDKDCTALWCHTPDRCSWEMLVKPACDKD